MSLHYLRNYLQEQGIANAKVVELKARSMVPFPRDKHTEALIKTIKIKSIYRGSDIGTYSRQETTPQAFFSNLNSDFMDFKGIEDIMKVSFSLGYDVKTVASAVDSLSFFNSKAISEEIGQFADSVVHIENTARYTSYSAGNVSFTLNRIAGFVGGRDPPFGPTHQAILDNIPILTMIPNLNNIISVIYEACKKCGYFNARLFQELIDGMNVVNCSWDFNWSPKQLLLEEIRNKHVNDLNEFALGKLPIPIDHEEGCYYCNPEVDSDGDYLDVYFGHFEEHFHWGSQPKYALQLEDIIQIKKDVEEMSYQEVLEKWVNRIDPERKLLIQRPAFQIEHCAKRQCV